MLPQESCDIHQILLRHASAKLSIIDVQPEASMIKETWSHSHKKKPCSCSEARSCC